MTFAFPPRSAAVDSPYTRPGAMAPHSIAPQQRVRRLRAVVALTVVGIVGGLSGCSSIEQMPIPFIKKRGPDLTNGRASAENMVRLDAAMRSGCDVVDNIERPPPKQDPRDPAPQRWVARTCHGDIVYDVTTVPGKDGPSIKVTPVPGPIDRPMNTHFVPAGLDGASDDAAPSSGNGAAPADIHTGQTPVLSK